ncbi:MAG TPA: hypothetical protein DDW73_04700 [Rhizobium sp.]|jgi:hypothetical protein|nr:hypothetical protein [Rhizobium sp.]
MTDKDAIAICYCGLHLPGRRSKPIQSAFFHIDIAEVQKAEGKLHLYAGIDRTSKFSFVALVEKANTATACGFLDALVAAVPYKVNIVRTDNGIQFADRPKNRSGPTAMWRGHPFDQACRVHGIEHRLTKPKHPWTNGQVERMNRTIKEGEAEIEIDPVNRFPAERQTLPLRQSRATSRPSRKLCCRLQFRSPSQQPEGAHVLRVHMQKPDFGARKIHHRSNPANAGNKQFPNPKETHPRG